MSPRSSHWLFIVTLLVVFVTLPSYAVHVADHRYTVWGLVESSASSPIPGVKVTVSVDGGAISGEALTDGDGVYRILLHLHNEDLGKLFSVTARNSTDSGEIKFDPNNNRAERIHEFNLTISQ